MHDRRIDGETEVFGNAGTLFMNAMTWYDHETESIWSQPWGRAINGERLGIELFLLPSQISTWATWRATHPRTLVMINDSRRLGFKEEFDPDFVIGLLLDDRSRAYYYEDVAAVTLVNDWLDEFPVVVWAANQTFHAYLRQVEGRTLTFQVRDGRLVDAETESTWDVSRGLAIDGPLQGQNLPTVPSATAYDWAWQDFYPQTTFWQPASD